MKKVTLVGTEPAAISDKARAIPSEHRSSSELELERQQQTLPRERKGRLLSQQAQQSVVGGRHQGMLGTTGRTLHPRKTLWAR